MRGGLGNSDQDVFFFLRFWEFTRGAGFLSCHFLSLIGSVLGSVGLFVDVFGGRLRGEGWWGGGVVGDGWWVGRLVGWLRGGRGGEGEWVGGIEKGRLRVGG